MPVKDICRKHSVSQGSFYAWRTKYSGMQVSDAKRLRELEDENRRLKRLVADQALDVSLLREVNSRKW
jgi:putative transposase